MFIGGLLGAFYIFTTIFTSPKIEFANMFSLVICGQILLAVISDHFGLLGNQIANKNLRSYFINPRCLYYSNSLIRDLYLNFNQ